jgi:hypothetical protein
LKLLWLRQQQPGDPPYLALLVQLADNDLVPLVVLLGRDVHKHVAGCRSRCGQLDPAEKLAIMRRQRDAQAPPMMWTRKTPGRRAMSRT